MNPRPLPPDAAGTSPWPFPLNHPLLAPHVTSLAQLPWLAIAGPTASGKTALALAIAQVHLIEIISVDSALVYRHMDIGTAKPTPAELAVCPHHLIDIREPDEPYSAAEFVQDAQRLVADIQSRGRLPLLVGGTMMYFKALWDGLDDMPSSDPAVREALEDEGRRLGWPALHARLREVDPITAERLFPNDAQRICRALEVWTLAGQPLSHFQTGRPRTPGQWPAINGQVGALWSLEPTDRAWLHHRIAQRYDAMLAQGFVDEVAQLATQPQLHADLPSIRCVGYRQTWQALQAASELATPLAPHSPLWVSAREQGIAATRQLAKRQLTWLRGMPGRTVLPCDLIADH